MPDSPQPRGPVAQGGSEERGTRGSASGSKRSDADLAVDLGMGLTRSYGSTHEMGLTAAERDQRLCQQPVGREIGPGVAQHLSAQQPQQQQQYMPAAQGQGHEVVQNQLQRAKPLPDGSAAQMIQKHHQTDGASSLQQLQQNASAYASNAAGNVSGSSSHRDQLQQLQREQQQLLAQQQQQLLQRQPEQQQLPPHQGHLPTPAPEDETTLLEEVVELIVTDSFLCVYVLAMPSLSACERPL